MGRPVQDERIGRPVQDERILGEAAGRPLRSS